ncbi:MAG TPA: putative Ig domain-containing protein [Bryobacteraceae bacterium]|nr:putative Ig domain-containing protein [Bryobacteraceae bacterium]
MAAIFTAAGVSVLKTISALALVVCSVGCAQSTSGVTVSPATLNFTYQIGAASLPAAQTLTVTPTPKTLDFTVAISGSPYNAAWLLVSETSGVGAASLKVEVNPTGLAAGNYAGTITVTAVNGNEDYTGSATVNLAVSSAAATVTATPSSLSFSYTTGDPIPSASLASAFILSSNGAPLSATLSISGASWLTATPSGDISLIGLLNTITVTVDPTGLAPKVYTGTIKISAPAATDKSLTLTVTLTVNAAAPAITSTWPAGVIQSSAQTIATLNGSAFFSNSTVTATGFTPATTISVTDGTSVATQTFLIPVYAATSTMLTLAVASPLPSGAVGTAYSQMLTAAGGTSPYTFTQLSGTMPAGLSINSAGVISGTPANAGTFLFTVGVTDSSSQPINAYNQVQLTIDPAGATALTIETAAAPLPIGIIGTPYGPVSLSAVNGQAALSWTATNLPPGFTLSSSGVLSGTPSTDGNAGPVAATAVSDSALLATIPAADMVQAGVLRMAVSTPAPGGGTSNEAQFQIYGPNPQITAVVNSASYAQGTLAPGDMIAIFGVGLGPSALTIFDPSSPPIPTALPAAAPSTSVTINGTAASVLYTSGTVVGVIVPYTTAGPSAQVVVTYGGLSSQPFTVAVAASDPGIYSLASSGQGQGAILNYNSSTGDFSINSASNPAAAGSTIVIYITGAGTTTSNVDDQLIPLSPAVTPLLAPTVSIGGQGAVVQAAQAPPGSVPGLIQLNVTVPAGLKSSQAAPVIVTVGGVASQTGLTMSVK